MSRLGIAREVFYYLQTSKRWWMTPILALLILVGFVIVFAEGSALAPFVYALF